MSPTAKTVLRATGIAVVIGLAVLGLALLRVFCPKWSGQVIDRLRGKLDEERAGLEVARTLAKDGAEAARMEVLARYSDKMEVLDAQQKAQAEKLAQDPVALARYLVRVGATSSR